MALPALPSRRDSDAALNRAAASLPASAFGFVRDAAGVVPQPRLERRLQEQLQTLLFGARKLTPTCARAQLFEAVAHRASPHCASSATSRKSGCPSTRRRSASFARRKRLRTVSSGAP